MFPCPFESIKEDQLKTTEEKTSSQEKRRKKINRKRLLRRKASKLKKGESKKRNLTEKTRKNTIKGKTNFKIVGEIETRLFA